MRRPMIGAALLLCAAQASAAHAADGAADGQSPGGSSSDAAGTAVTTTLTQSEDAGGGGGFKDMPERADEVTGTPDSRPFLLSAGGTYWHGDFGAPTKTDIYSAAISARYRTGNLRLTAILPWMRIRSDGLILTGIGGTPLIIAPKSPTGKRVHDGVSDLTLGASYLLSAGGGIDVELLGRVKLPTASDSSGVSTGKTDYSGGVEISKNFGRFTPSVSVTYRVFGDMRDWKLRNGVAATATGTFAISGKTVALVSYDYAQAATRFVHDSHEILAGVSTPVGMDRLRLTAFGSAGLSSGAPDVAVGLSLSFKV